MDIKTLFHNPEELSDQELMKISNKISFQKHTRLIFGVFGGVSTYVIDSAFLRRSFCYKRVAVGTLLGYGFGMWAIQSSTNSSCIDKNFDSDIINAFDQRYARTVLNSTGFGSNYVSIRDYSQNINFKKPY